jgi:hypothetical protein
MVSNIPLLHNKNMTKRAQFNYVLGLTARHGAKRHVPTNKILSIEESGSSGQRLEAPGL